jgi:hypothetical protein
MNRYSLNFIHVRIPLKMIIPALLFFVYCFSYGPTAHATTPTGTSDLVQFIASGHVLGFEARRMHVASGDHVLSVEFAGTDGVKPVADQMPKGDEHALPLKRVDYPELWPSISLSYEVISGGIVRSSYLLKPGADVGQIRLRYNTQVEIESGGRLRIGYESGWMNESAPVAWQEIGGKRIPVTVAFYIYDSSIKNSTVGFSLDQYNHAYPLIIDPTLSWNTFIGGTDSDNAFAISLDSSGNVYVVGDSDSTWGSPLNAHTGGHSDGFVAKLNSSGVLQWNTFIGGTDDDGVRAISTDSSGNLYVVGYSYGPWGSPLNAYAGGYSDGFVAKLNSRGVLQWNTFIGGTGGDGASAISIDSNGNLYVGGDSTISTWGSPLNARSGWDAFVAKLNSSGVLQWNSFVGGNDADYACAISIDASGNVYVAGSSFDPLGSSPQTPFAGVSYAFVAKLSSMGVLQWNTIMRGADSFDAADISTDSSGNVYMVGTSFSTWSSPLNPYAGGSDAFVTKLNSSGVLQWNTFMGGTSNDYASAISMDSSGNLYVTGFSGTTWGSPLNPYAGGSDAFVTKLNSSGVLQWHTFMGGASNDYAGAISMDSSGNLYIAGFSDATWGSPLNAYTEGEYGDAFVAKLTIDIDKDGMDDEWESSYFGHTLRDGTKDYDSDNLNDLREYQNGTNPKVFDTDGDGLSDGNEVDDYNTNPTIADSDGDAMPDGWEVTNGLNPLLDDAAIDNDGDGYNNLIEYKRGTNPQDSSSHPSKSMPWLPLLLE